MLRVNVLYSLETFQGRFTAREESFVGEEIVLSLLCASDVEHHVDELWAEVAH